MSESKPVTTRRHVLAAAGATIALQTGRALGQQQLGPPPHAKGPLVFLNYDQIELDAAYNQNVYEPSLRQVMARLTSNSEAVRKRIGQPQRESYVSCRNAILRLSGDGTAHNTSDDLSNSHECAPSAST
jgi:hypothetical protein